MKTQQPIIVLAFIIQLIEGKLKCYECDSRKDPQCGKTFGYTEQQAENAGLLKDCAEDQICRKMSVNIYKDKFVVRRCAKSAVLECREIRKDESHICDCAVTGCNNQNMVKAYAGVVISLFTLQKLLMYVY